MAGAILRVLLALVAFAGAIGVAPDFWQGRFGWKFVPASVTPPTVDLEDAELVLGALVFRTASRMSAPAEWTRAIRRDPAVDETYQIYLGCTGASMLTPGDTAVGRLQDRLTQAPFSSPGGQGAWPGFPPAKLEVAVLDEIDEILARGYDERTHALHRALVRYLVSIGRSRSEAVGRTLADWTSRSWRSPAAWASATLGSVDIRMLTSAEQARVAALRARLDGLAARHALPTAANTAWYDALVGNRYLLTNAYGVASLLAAMILCWFWLLLGWILLRRRSDAVGIPGRPGWLTLLRLVVLPAGMGALGLFGGDDTVGVLAILGMGIAVSLQARARGSTSRSVAPHSHRLHATAVLLILLLATVVGVAWSTVLGSAGHTFDEFAAASAMCCGIVCGVGMIITPILWARPEESQQRGLRRTLVASVIIVTLLTSGLGLSSVTRSAALMSSPLGGAIWAMLLGICYWFARRLAGRSKVQFDPRRLVAHRLLPPLSILFAVAIIVPPAANWGILVPASLILTGLTLMIVFADGSLASSATHDGAADKSFATRASAWTAALADGILVTALALVAWSAWARFEVEQQIQLAETLMGLR